MIKVLIVVTLLIVCVNSSREVMRTLTLNFARPMEVCKKELDLPDSVFVDFFNFWKEDYEITNRMTGCAILCLSTKLELLDENLGIHHGNAQEFAKRHGADDAMAQQMLDKLHNCNKAVAFSPGGDACIFSLDVANCFKAEIHKLNWAPGVDLVVTEVLSDG